MRWLGSGGTDGFSPFERHPRLTFAGFLVVLLLAAELFVRGFVSVRNVGPAFSEFDPQLGKALKKSASIVRVTPEFRMRLTTNSLGLRGPEPEPPGAVWRHVAFAGDSFTMGYGVTDGLEFPALVRADLSGAFGADRQVEVWNLGIGASGTGRLLRYLELNPTGIQPDVVVYQFCSNDFSDNRREGLYRLRRDGTLASLEPGAPGPLRRVQDVVDRLPLLHRSHLFSLAREAAVAGALSAAPGDAGSTRSAGQPAPAESRRPARPDALTYALVAEVLARIREMGAVPVVLTLDLEGAREKRMRRLFGEAGVRHHVRIPDRQERPDLYFEIDGHWNEAGHRFAADRLTPLLVDVLAAEPDGPPEER